MPLFDNLGYGNEKTSVVFDIGAAFTKCGFGGENSPRCIIPSSVKRPKSGEVVRVHDVTDADELYGVLLDFVHVLYFRHVLVNPKERRIVIVESVLTPSVFRETLARVLFKHYEVPSVLFAPSHLMALFTLGIQSSLVMDAGYTETQVLPVYEGIPIMKACQSLPLGGKAIHSELIKQLKERTPVTPESLQEAIVEDIKVKCCFVTKFTRAKDIHAVYNGQEGAQMPSPPPDVQYPLDGSAVMIIPGAIREHTCEVLFEQDSEEKSVATLVLDSILQCPLDLRKTMADNIVLIGGTSMLPGFKHRLLCELRDLMTKPRYKNLLALKSFKFHSPPAKENFVAWLGGAIFGALEILANRSISRDQYSSNNCMLPDWCSMFEYEDKDERANVLLRKEASKEGSASLKKEQSLEGVTTKSTKA